jgi:hypothetical protein
MWRLHGRGIAEPDPLAPPRASLEACCSRCAGERMAVAWSLADPRRKQLSRRSSCSGKARRIPVWSTQCNPCASCRSRLRGRPLMSRFAHAWNILINQSYVYVPMYLCTVYCVSVYAFSNHDRNPFWHPNHRTKLPNQNRFPKAKVASLPAAHRRICKCP